MYISLLNLSSVDKSLSIKKYYSNQSKPISFQGTSQNIPSAITLEEYPNIEYKLNLHPSSERNVYQLVKTYTEKEVPAGFLKLGTKYQVELYAGKGGISAILRQKGKNDIHFNIFECSRIELKDGTMLSLFGDENQGIALSPSESEYYTPIQDPQHYTTQAYIPTGGMASRIYPLSEKIAKPALPISRLLK